MRKNFRRPQPLFTHGLEEDLDKSFASLQSQLDLLEKLQKIFGETPSDPVIAFQLKKIKQGLTNDVRKLALTGTDLHELQEQFGAEIVRGTIIDARQKINQEKEGHNGQLTDMINDDQFARAYHERHQPLDPLVKKALIENVQVNMVNDPARIELQKQLEQGGKSRKAAEAQSIKAYTKVAMSDQDKQLRELLLKGSVSDTVLQKLIPPPEEEEEGKEEEEEPADLMAEEIKQQRDDAHAAYEEYLKDIPKNIAENKVREALFGGMAKRIREAKAARIEEEKKEAAEQEAAEQEAERERQAAEDENKKQKATKIQAAVRGMQAKKLLEEQRKLRKGDMFFQMREQQKQIEELKKQIEELKNEPEQEQIHEQEKLLEEPEEEKKMVGKKMVGKKKALQKIEKEAVMFGEDSTKLTDQPGYKTLATTMQDTEMTPSQLLQKIASAPNREKAEEAIVLYTEANFEDQAKKQKVIDFFAKFAEKKPGF